MSISYQAKVFLTVYYVALLIVGVPGNFLTCAFTVEKTSRKMSPTNCFLLNLAIVDLLTLIIGEKGQIYQTTNAFLFFGIFSRLKVESQVFSIE